MHLLLAGTRQVWSFYQKKQVVDVKLLQFLIVVDLCIEFIHMS